MIIDSQVHAYEANTPGRPWHSVPNWPAHVTGEEMVAAMDAVGVEDPAACVYVGDRPFEDVHGAQRAGMRAVLVPHSDIPVDQQVPLEVHPDAVVHRLLEVLDHVDAWSRPPGNGPRA